MFSMCLIDELGLFVNGKFMGLLLTLMLTSPFFSIKYGVLNMFSLNVAWSFVICYAQLWLFETE